MGGSNENENETGTGNTGCSKEGERTEMIFITCFKIRKSSHNMHSRFVCVGDGSAL